MPTSSHFIKMKEKRASIPETSTYKKNFRPAIEQPLSHLFTLIIS